MDGAGKGRTEATWVVPLLLLASLAGCLGGNPPLEVVVTDPPPFLGYAPQPPDPDMEWTSTYHFADVGDTKLHVRLVKPPGEGPFPVLITAAPNTGGWYGEFADEVIHAGVARWHEVFVRRGYAMAHADMRGFGDSSGCADFMGPRDLADLSHLIDWAAVQPWSDGNVGFLGGMYSGTFLAALSGHPSLKAVASHHTLFSYYHHNFGHGVPYSVHRLGGEQNQLAQYSYQPTVNPQYENYGTRYLDRANCSSNEVLLLEWMDQSGAYTDFWKLRNHEARIADIAAPILMSDGFARFYYRPDQTTGAFNEIPTQKTLVMGQWGQWTNQNPISACKPGQTVLCDDQLPYRDWDEYRVSFFDTYLKGIETGMFQTDVVWIQDTTGAWHRSSNWPLLPQERDEIHLHFTPAGEMAPEKNTASGELAWYGCARDKYTYGHQNLRMAFYLMRSLCDKGGLEDNLVFFSTPFERDVILSGVPRIELTLRSESESTHITVVVFIVDDAGMAVDRLPYPIWIDLERDPRITYGYFNPVFRNGLENGAPIKPGEPYAISFDLMPLEAVVKSGERLKIIIASHDRGNGYIYERSAQEARTVEWYEPGANTILFGPERANTLLVPLRPPELQGTRLD